MPDIPPIVVTADEWAIVHAILRKHLPDREVWAFGSRAAGKAKRYADLDLAIISETPRSWRILGEMADDVPESDRPWRVDILDWATVSPTFRKIIEQSRVVIQRPNRHSP